MEEKQSGGVETEVEEKDNKDAQVQDLKSNEEEQKDINDEIEEGLASVPAICIQAASESEGEDKESEEKEESDEISNSQKIVRSSISSPVRNTQNSEYHLLRQRIIIVKIMSIFFPRIHKLFNTVINLYHK